MRRVRAWGKGRKCLVVSPRAARIEPVVDALVSAGFEVERASTEASALAALERGPIAAAFLAQAMGALALGTIVAHAANIHPQVPVVVLGSTSAVQDVVDAMQNGAADYVALPADPDLLLSRLRALLDRATAAASAAPSLQPGFMGIVGNSAAIRRVLDSVEKISRYKANVLVLGESGTGKEIVARALHARGPRRQHLFVPLNCATLGREILENELFGHEKGAFTGAGERKKGLFELADGGTLFLDEIVEMDPGTQAKLLRVLERSEFRRVGGTVKVKVDLTVIAATNRKIDEAIHVGKLREDLYYRLKVVTIALPPLRERKEDIPALIEAFIADFNRRHGGKIHGISPSALKLIMEYPWPGNVRELKNAIESAAILAGRETIGSEAFADLVAVREPEKPRGASPGDALVLPVGTTLAEAERELILATMRRHPTRAEAARALGLGLRTLYTKLAGYGAETARRVPELRVRRPA
ncbi:MAG: sigma 54-interacting transcriptional regulator [Myxococcales bacterium]